MTEPENIDDVKAKIALGALFHRTRWLKTAKRTPPLWVILLDSVFIIILCTIVPDLTKKMLGDEALSVRVALGAPLVVLFAMIQGHIIRLDHRIDALVKLLDIDKPKDKQGAS
jgi:hypothetical protein